MSRIPYPASPESLTWISRNASLPKVLIYSTGGTILNQSKTSRLDNFAYGGHNTHPPKVEDLIKQVDEVLDIAQLGVVNFPWAVSNDLTAETFIKISRHFKEFVCPEESGISGAIVVHGSNTLAETIFGIDLTLSSSKPIVAVASMRPQNALSSDAYLNFYQAISTAASPLSRDRGALIVANDHITSAYFGTKAHANNPDTFMALEQGHLGSLFAGQPYYFYEPARPVDRHYFDLTDVTEVLPKVAILYCHLEFDASLMLSAVDAGSRGIIVVGVGPGDLNKAGSAAVLDLVTQGFPVIRTARPFTGSACPCPCPDSRIKANFMSAEHARIQLQLCLAKDMSIHAIREVFEGPFRRAIYNQGTSFYDKK